jgi:hypothetical protein
MCAGKCVYVWLPTPLASNCAPLESRARAARAPLAALPLPARPGRAPPTTPLSPTTAPHPISQGSRVLVPGGRLHV